MSWFWKRRPPRLVMQLWNNGRLVTTEEVDSIRELIEATGKPVMFKFDGATLITLRMADPL